MSHDDSETIMVTERLAEVTDRHERVRHIRGEDPVSLSELLAHLTEELGGEEGMNRFGGSLILSRGYHFRWTSPETDEELAHRVYWANKQQERQDEWERKTYARLREKFRDQE